MFKKMRKRLLLSNVMLFGALITASFVAIYVLTYVSIQTEISVLQNQLMTYGYELQAGTHQDAAHADSEETASGASVDESVVAAGKPLEEASIGWGGGTTPYCFYIIDEQEEPLYIRGIFDQPLDYYDAMFDTVWAEAVERRAQETTGSTGETPSIEDYLALERTMRVDANGKPLSDAEFARSEFTVYAASPVSSNAIGELTVPNPSHPHLQNTWFYLTTSYGAATTYQGTGEIISTDPAFTIVAFLDITSYKEQLFELAFRLVLIGVASLVLLCAVSVVVTNRAMRPVKESWQKQKQFVADASHELRSPLAALGATVDAIETNATETVESQVEWFTNIRTDLSRMSQLTGDLLYLAESEDVEEAADEPIDLSLMCKSAVSSMEAQIFNRNIELETAISEGIVVSGNSERLKQVVVILLDNASKYTNEGGTITISLQKNKHHAELVVQNTGEGIAEEHLPKIFDRFYRTDASRTGESGGFGLGLAIAKAIVERSGGTISAKSKDGATTLTVTLKL